MFKSEPELKVRMRKIKDIPTNERPCEKLLAQGAKALADHELLAIILGKGSKKRWIVNKLLTILLFILYNKNIKLLLN